MSREIVLDTETTGLEPSAGHRLVEIGCVELINYIPSGRFFHTYINPEREVPKEAHNIHGLSYDFLKDHPSFKEIVHSFLEFIEEDPLVIHNAKFDMKFLNAELERLGLPELPSSRAIDTLAMARKKFPGSPASLDALCKKWGVDNTAREKHGALLDAELLSQVYLELIGGKQPGLSLHFSSDEKENVDSETMGYKTHRLARAHQPTQEELDLHHTLLGKLKDPLWLR